MSKFINACDTRASGTIEIKSQNAIFTYFPRTPREWFFTEFGLWDRLADSINCAKCFGNRFNGLDYVTAVGKQSSYLFIDLVCRC